MGTSRSTFLHVPEGGVAEAVGTQRVALPSGARRPQHQLKVVQRTAKLLVQLDGSVLGQAVGLIAVGAVESARLGLQTEELASFKSCSWDTMTHRTTCGFSVRLAELSDLIWRSDLQLGIT